jgi:predicted secreted Zn-dependent protease
MDKRGYTDTSGQHWDAYTDWDVSWSYPYSRTDAKCSAGPVQATVAITFTFPTWHIPKGTHPDVIGKWNDYMDSLEAHENGHKEIAIAAAYAVVEILEALPAYPSCSELELAADNAAQDVLQQYRQREATYDQTTDHGATQGASFP